MNDKKVKNSSSVKKNTSTKKSSTKKTAKQLELMQMSNDELLEQILAKKKARQEKSKAKKEEINKRLIADKDNVESEILKKDLNVTSENSIEKKKSEKKGLISDKDKVSSDLVLKIVKVEKKEKSKEDINNEQLLTDIKEAVQIENAEDDNVKSKSHSIKRKDLKIIALIIFIILLVIIPYFIVTKVLRTNIKDDKITELIDTSKKEEAAKKEEEQKKKELEEKYNLCLDEAYNDNDTSLEISAYIDELNDYLESNYSVSISYYDLNLGFEYKYNENIKYYAASTMKSLAALYIYDKAWNDEINLDDTITYTSKYKWGASKFMQSHKYGDAITIRELVKYSVIVSDNSSYQMLVDYIGKSNLREYGKSLGASLTMSGSDNFGYIDVNDCIIYMKAINDFINNSETLGLELQSYFLEAEQNDLALTDIGIKAAHKYGQYNEFYHDIGIVYDEHPYVIAIMTREGLKDFEEIVKDINRRVYKIHQLYYQNRENVCHQTIYAE